MSDDLLHAAPEPEDTQHLVSVAVVASRASDALRARICDVAEHVSASYAFAECLVLLSDEEDAGDMLDRVAATGVQVRLLQIQGAATYDDLAMVAYREAIGDLVLVVSADELGFIDIAAMLERLRAGNDLVRLRRRGEHALERIPALAVRLLTGLKVDIRYLRTLGISRLLLSELLPNADLFQLFRFRANQFVPRQSVIEVDAPQPRPGPRSILRRIDLAARLISVATPRLLRLCAVLSWGLALAALAFLVYAVAVNFIIAEVAAGWTSLSLVIGTWMAVQMAAVGTICLALSRSIDRQERQPTARVVHDVSSGDMFARARLLNVEPARGHEPADAARSEKESTL